MTFNGLTPQDYCLCSSHGNLALSAIIINISRVLAFSACASPFWHRYVLPFSPASWHSQPTRCLSGIIYIALFFAALGHHSRTSWHSQPALLASRPPLISRTSWHSQPALLASQPPSHLTHVLAFSACAALLASQPPSLLTHVMAFSACAAGLSATIISSLLTHVMAFSACAAGLLATISSHHARRGILNLCCLSWHIGIILLPMLLLFTQFCALPRPLAIYHLIISSCAFRHAQPNLLAGAATSHPTSSSYHRERLGQTFSRVSVGIGPASLHECLGLLNLLTHSQPNLLKLLVSYFLFL